MDYAALVTAFVTLFVVIDPIALTPFFVTLTQGMPAPRRRAIALRSCTVAAGLLTAFGLLGNSILEFIGISMPAFQIAGGILLFLTALDMLFERRTKRREGQTKAEEADNDPSVFPLAMPLMAGPGAMATMVLLAGAPGIGWAEALAVHVVMFAVVALLYVFYLSAGALERVLGKVGINVVTRLLGMLLAALSVQFVVDGVAALGLISK